MWKSLVLSVLLVGLCSGCLGTRFVMDSARLYPPESIITNQYQPRDLPIPKGFDFLPNDSFAYVGSFRVVDLQYIGDGLVEHVANFFDDQLPRDGWSYLRREGVLIITMVYVNDRNEVRLTLRRLGHKTHLRMRVLPRDVKPQGL